MMLALQDQQQAPTKPPEKPLSKDPQPLPVIGFPTSPNTKPTQAKSVAQLRAMQYQLFDLFQEPKTSIANRCLIARTFVLLQESIRISRGIPSPGQLRPDLDPVQMARMLKRARKRQPIDIPSDIRAALKSAKGKAWAEEPSDKPNDT